ncbi:head-tail joining protein [Spongiibacter sp. UBA1325]|uniref:head-tail joining protein n=1 Tax=Spongiibacter sp. UBA1325 TaxID=1947543 RepID=UPI00257E745D|nr:hypothetical protein [Spongiibacter sp. UBA1325]|tara:strand:- start:2381 stop:2695 length:315 start_codon:yes stop_codon:yes gene_type:complete
MSFKSLKAAMTVMARGVFGSTVTVTPPSAGAIPGVGAIIDKGAEVVDDYGVVTDTRIEIELFRSEVGGVGRGTLVLDDETAETFRLLEPIDIRGEVMRWVASEV